MSNKIKIIHSEMTGAPALNQAASSQITVLEAALCNGFGSVTATSVVISGGVATATFASGHPFDVYSLSLFAGAGQTEVNGEQRILSKTTNTVTFACALPDQTATGTITAKVAPAGWAKVFTGSNVAVFQSLNVAGRRPFLRVEDAAGTDARVVGYESMTDASTGTGKTPTDALVSGGGYWPKANNATGNRSWLIIADDRTFYFWIAPSSAAPAVGHLYGFGDDVAEASPAAYDWFINCAEASDASFGRSYDQLPCVSGALASITGLFMPRPVSGLGSATRAYKYAPGLDSSNQFSGSTSQILTFPNPGSNALTLGSLYAVTPTIANATDTLGTRGRLPGLSVSPQKVGGANYTHRSIWPVGGKAIMMVGVGDTAVKGVVGINVDGPWQ